MWLKNRIRRVMNEGAEKTITEAGIISRVQDELVPADVDGLRWSEFTSGRHDEIQVLLHVAEQFVCPAFRKTELSLETLDQFRMLIAQNIVRDLVHPS